MRVLLLAESCNPEWPSLPLVAFKAARAISELADVVLVTQVRNRPAIERAGGVGRAEVVYIDTEYIAAPLHKLSTLLRGGNQVSWTTQVAFNYPSYVAFERQTHRRFRKDLEARTFDVVHRLTPMSPTLPSPMAKWSRVPFVLGPINGGLRWPTGFLRELHREREYLSYLRGLYRLLPYYADTYSGAAAILASFQHTIDDLPAAARDRTIDFPEVGIDPSLFDSATRSGASPQVTFVYVGRLVPYKCPDVAISAFAESPVLRTHRLLVVGDGPERPHLERMVATHRLGDCVQLLGWKSQADVASILRSADVMVFPSIRELGAGVVVEAMACGCVPVVVAYGAPAELVTDECGVRVPLGEKGDLVDGFVRALEALASDLERRSRLGAAAHQRAEAHLTWPVKARKTLEVYEWVVGQRSVKPRFWEDRGPPRGVQWKP